MNLSDADLKKLWGLAAGICSAPECHQDCIPFLDPKTPTVIGEMAHVIAQSKDGPRGDGKNAGEDTYENLILLCPTCHTKIDKAPANTYSREVLLKWKTEHEKARSSLKAPRYENLQQLAKAVSQLLEENYLVWKKYGPESELAKSNPFSAGARIWTFQKLSIIHPNNRRIAQLLKSHKDIIPVGDWSICAEFIQHASIFEQSSYQRIDSAAVLRFPQKFGELINSLNR
jgi:HNH endonuclease